MTDRIPVGDVDGPLRHLCYAQKPGMGPRCDRKRGHLGRHSWEYGHTVKSEWAISQEYEAYKGTPGYGVRYYVEVPPPVIDR